MGRWGCMQLMAEALANGCQRLEQDCQGAATRLGGAEEDGNGDEEDARVFTGDHAAHVVEVLAAIAAVHPDQGQALSLGGQEARGEEVSRMAGKGSVEGGGAGDTETERHRGAGGIPPRIHTHICRITSYFRPLPMLQARVVPRKRIRGVGGGVGRVEASRLVLGTMALGDGKAKDPNEVLDAAWALGINCLDLAHAYGRGSVESSVGSWIRARGIPRTELVLVGKACHPYGNRPRLSQECLEADLSESLTRLGTDYLDLLLLHRDTPHISAGNVVEWLHALVQQGRIRAWGTSNWSPSRRRELVAFARTHALTLPAADSPQRSLAVPALPVWPDTTAIDAEAVRQYAEEGQSGVRCEIFGWAPLACGFLAGKWTSEDAKRPLNAAYGEGRMIKARGCVRERRRCACVREKEACVRGREGGGGREGEERGRGRIEEGG
jgi:aryl-alcohol dehydrogenase-like predicted oxidoreductase